MNAMTFFSSMASVVPASDSGIIPVLPPLSLHCGAMSIKGVLDIDGQVGLASKLEPEEDGQLVDDLPAKTGHVDAGGSRLDPRRSPSGVRLDRFAEMVELSRVARSRHQVLGALER